MFNNNRYSHLLNKFMLLNQEFILFLTKQNRIYFSLLLYNRFYMKYSTQTNSCDTVITVETKWNFCYFIPHQSDFFFKVNTGFL